MGLHTGIPHLTDEGYVGEVVHEGARIAAAGRGGQVLLSEQTRELAQVEATDLGEHRLKDIEERLRSSSSAPDAWWPHDQRIIRGASERPSHSPAAYAKEGRARTRGSGP